MVTLCCACQEGGISLRSGQEARGWAAAAAVAAVCRLPPAVAQCGGPYRVVCHHLLSQSPATCPGRPGAARTASTTATLLFWLFLAQTGIQDLSCVVRGVVWISTPANPSAAGRPLSK